MLKLGKKDLFWSHFAQIFRVGSALFLLPFVLRFLTESEIALWYLFLTVSSLLFLLDFGFGPTIQRNVSYIFAGARGLSRSGINEDHLAGTDGTVDFGLLHGLISSTRKIYRWLALASFAILLVTGSWYLHSFSAQVPGWRLYSSWMLYLISATANLYYFYYTPLLLGRGKFEQLNKATIFSNIASLVVSCVGIAAGLGIVSLGLGNLVAMAVNRYLSRRFFYDAEVRDQLLAASRSANPTNLFPILWHNSYRMGLVAVGTFLILRANLLIVGKFAPLQAVAAYGLSLQVLDFISKFSQTLFMSSLPLLNQARIRKDAEEVAWQFGRGLFASHVVFLLGAGGFMVLGPPILRMFGANSQVLELPLLALLALILLLEQNHSVCATLLTTRNEVPFVVPALASGACIAAGSLVLARQFGLGVAGVLLSQFLVQLAYNNWKWPIEAFRDLGIGPFSVLRLILRRFWSARRSPDAV